MVEHAHDCVGTMKPGCVFRSLVVGLREILVIGQGHGGVFGIGRQEERRHLVTVTQAEGVVMKPILHTSAPTQSCHLQKTKTTSTKREQGEVVRTEAMCLWSRPREYSSRGSGQTRRGGDEDILAEAGARR